MSTTQKPLQTLYPLLEQTFERYPTRWYENIKLLIGVAAAMAAILLVLQLQFSIPVSPGAWASVLAVAGWSSVWLMDVISTGLIGEMKVKFDQRGFEPFGAERNSFLPPYPTWRDLVVNWTNVGSLVLCVLFWFVPVFALISIVFRGGIALGNLRTLKRLKLAMAWVE